MKTKKKILSMLISMGIVLSSVMLTGCGNEKANDNVVNNVVNNVVEKDTHTTHEKETTQNEEKSIHVGDEIKFGHYEQGGILDYKEDIEWIVLDVEEDRLLLVSKYALKLAPFHEQITDKNISWSNSSIHSWLNNDFFEIAFSNCERDVVCTTTLSNSEEDKVFLLSTSEAKEYFDNDTERKCYVIGWSSDKDELLSGHGWWLRSPGENSGTIAYVMGNGEISYKGTPIANDGFSYNSSYANEWYVRPALWINSTMLEELMQSDKQDSEKTYSKNEYLRKVLDAYLSYGIVVDGACRYNFAHLDEDYFPELVVIAAGDDTLNEYESSFTVYTYKDGKVIVTECSDYFEFENEYGDYFEEYYDCEYFNEYDYEYYWCDDVYDTVDVFRDNTHNGLTPY